MELPKSISTLLQPTKTRYGIWPLFALKRYNLSLTLSSRRKKRCPSRWVSQVYNCHLKAAFAAVCHPEPATCWLVVHRSRIEPNRLLALDREKALPLLRQQHNLEAVVRMRRHLLAGSQVDQYSLAPLALVELLYEKRRIAVLF